MGVFNDNINDDHVGHIKIQTKGAIGPPGRGFKLTADGNYDMDGKRLTNAQNPVDDADLTNKQYVDAEDAKQDAVINNNATLITDSLRLDGSKSMTGDLDMGNNKITNMKDPTGDQDAVTRKYLQTFVGDLHISSSNQTDVFVYVMDDHKNTLTAHRDCRVGDLI